MFFDPQTGVLNLDEQVHSRPSFKKIMEDMIVTNEEVEEQSQLVISLLKDLEVTLLPSDLEKVNNIIVEMSVLYAVSQIKILQDINK